MIVYCVDAWSPEVRLIKNQDTYIWSWWDESSTLTSAAAVTTGVDDFFGSSFPKNNRFDTVILATNRNCIPTVLHALPTHGIKRMTAFAISKRSILERCVTHLALFQIAKQRSCAFRRPVIQFSAVRYK